MKYNFLLLRLYRRAACMWGGAGNRMLPCDCREGEGHILKKKTASQKLSYSGSSVNVKLWSQCSHIHCLPASNQKGLLGVVNCEGREPCTVWGLLRRDPAQTWDVRGAGLCSRGRAGSLRLSLRRPLEGPSSRRRRPRLIPDREPMRGARALPLCLQRPVHLVTARD